MAVGQSGRKAFGGLMLRASGVDLATGKESSRSRRSAASSRRLGKMPAYVEAVNCTEACPSK